jgi:predicted flavoprotein YhiN
MVSVEVATQQSTAPATHSYWLITGQYKWPCLGSTRAVRVVSRQTTHPITHTSANMPVDVDVELDTVVDLEADVDVEVVAVAIRVAHCT